MFGNLLPLVALLQAGSMWMQAAPLPLETIAASARALGQRQVLTRTYRVHATILLLGMPIFTRKDVGSGFSGMERASADGVQFTSLQFGAGSDPVRARGLNRLGVFHEVLLRQKEQTEKAAYFGFMTGSDEDNLDQAKAAVAKQGDRALFKVISGTASPSRSEATVYPVDAPSTLQWAKRRELSDHLRANLPADGKQQSTAMDAQTRTFLRAILETLESPESKTASKVVYNGKLYSMTASKSADGALTRVDGVMHANGSKTPFRIWYGRDGGNPLPVKMEYKARSFLRLVLEAEN